MEIVTKNNQVVRVHIPSGSYTNPNELQTKLFDGIIKLIENEYLIALHKEPEILASPTFNEPRAKRSKTSATTQQREEKETDAMRVENEQVAEQITMTTKPERLSVVKDIQKHERTKETKESDFRRVENPPIIEAPSAKIFTEPIIPDRKEFPVSATEKFVKQQDVP
jgi:ABC-type Fe3+/spermidine/putrescine transport system ATPase subunit